MVANKLDLPFKPFTLTEIAEITGASSKLIDYWYNKVLPERTGDDRVTKGLDIMQTYAVFVGSRWLHEGAGYERANLVVVAVASMTVQTLEALLQKDLTFPVFTKEGATIGPAPNLPLGRKLNLKTLWLEFQHNLRKVFPNG